MSHGRKAAFAVLLVLAAAAAVFFGVNSAEFNLPQETRNFIAKVAARYGDSTWLASAVPPARPRKNLRQ